MKRALLEAIVNGLVLTSLDVKRYVQSTLLHYTEENNTVVTTAVADSLAFLEEGKFITSTAIDIVSETSQSENRRYETTKLGQATVSSALAPEESLIVYREITKALQSFILADEVFHAHLSIVAHSISSHSNVFEP
jgi:hypothetical protein